MPTCSVRKCCCCLTLLGGSWVVAVLALVGYLICTIVLVVKSCLALKAGQPNRGVLLASVAGVTTLMFVSACYLVHGLRKNIPAHLSCWVWSNMGMVMLAIITFMTLSFYYYIFRHDKTSGRKSIIGCVVAFCCSYFVVVVYSYEMEMRKMMVADPVYWDREHGRLDPF